GLRAAHRQRQLVGEKVAGEIHYDRDHQAVINPSLAGKGTPAHNQDRAEQPEQRDRLQGVITVIHMRECAGGRFRPPAPLFTYTATGSVCFVNFSLPSPSRSTTTVSPARNSPASSRSARGSCTSRWIDRRIGRAP